MADKNKTTYVCKRLRLLKHLKERGFLPYQTVPDMDNPRYNVWFFDDTEDGFQEALAEYFNQFK